MKIGLDIDKYRDTKIFRSKGCGKCHHTGYKGRQGIFELLLMNKDMKSCVLTTSDANEIRRRAIEENGLVTLRHDGARKVLEGTTTIEEVYRVCQE